LVSTPLVERLVDLIPAALFLTTTDGLVLSWNQGAQVMFGYRPDEALGKVVSDLICPPEMASFTQGMLVDACSRGLVEFEATDRTQSGVLVYTQSTIQLVVDPGDRRLIFLKRDITASVYRRQVQALEVKFRGLLEAVPDALVIVNSQGRILLINSQTERLFGYSREDLLVQPIERLVPDRFQAVHPGHRTQYFSDPHPRPMGAGRDLYARRRDGSEFLAEISLSPFESEVGPLAMAAVRDVSERRGQEEARRRALEEMNLRIQEANRLKSEFLANMSHELRTPLNAILGFSEVLLDGRVGPINPDQEEFLGDIHSSSRHLLQLINDVLDLSKVESGKMDFHPVRFDPRTLVDELVDTLKTLVQQNKLSLVVEIDPQLGVLSFDQGRLKQILYNYISNAIKFTPEGGRIVVRFFPTTPEEVRIEVEDTGIGIAPGDLETLFVEFHQLDNGATKKYQGTGLGLALTKRLVEAQGGTVGVSSVLGKGSLFFAVFPWTKGGEVG
jgi:protein-histidine pros-kinase